jgi:hypothetical protein
MISSLARLALLSALAGCAIGSLQARAGDAASERAGASITMRITPNPVALGGRFTVSVSGARVGQRLAFTMQPLHVAGFGGGIMGSHSADALGKIHFTYPAPTQRIDAGQWRLTAQAPGGGILAAATLTVTFSRPQVAATSVASGRMPAQACSNAAPPLTLPPGTRLILARPVPPFTASQPETPVQLCEILANGGVRPMYHVLPTSDVDVSGDGRMVAYSDRGGRVHLAGVVSGTDHVVARGVGPRFAADGQALAFIASATAPLPGGREVLEVYYPATGQLQALGPAVVPRVGLVDPAALIAWAPHGERLAWLRPNVAGTRFTLAVATLGSAGPAVVATTATGMASGPAWDAAGASILYWQAAGQVGGHGAPTMSYRIMRWRVPNGPLTTAVPATPTDWFEGLAAAPVPAPHGSAIASLLGRPRGGLTQVVLYTPGHGATAIALPGQPTAVRFEPVGSVFVAIWLSLTPGAPTSHASLVDTATGSVRDLGPALGAFWTRSRSS